MHCGCEQALATAALASSPAAATTVVLVLEVLRMVSLPIFVPFRDAAVHKVRLFLSALAVVQLVLMYGLLDGACGHACNTTARRVLMRVCVFARHTDDPSTRDSRQALGTTGMVIQYVAMATTMLVAIRGALLAFPKIKKALPEIMHEQPAEVLREPVKDQDGVLVMNPLGSTTMAV